MASDVYNVLAVAYRWPFLFYLRPSNSLFLGIVLKQILDIIISSVHISYIEDKEFCKLIQIPAL